jgi:hypothetical protein
MALVLEWATRHRDDLMEDWKSMQSTANTETDRAVEVVPQASHTVPWRVTSVEALPNSQLDVTFVDGTTGKVDMRNFLRSPTVDGTVFESPRERAFFAEALVVMGAVQWPNGADLAPDSMYDAIEKSGVWVLD